MDAKSSGTEDTLASEVCKHPDQADLHRHIEIFKRVHSISDFKFLGELSAGAGGQVFVGALADDDGLQLKYAIKRFDANADTDRKSMAGKESAFMAAAKCIKLHKQVDMEQKLRAASQTLADHDNIVYCFGAVDDPANSAVKSLVFELCEADLTQIINARILAGCEFFAEEDLMIAASDLLCALRDMHACGYVHRDVALPNVLYVITYSQIRLKIADFGLATPCLAGSPPLSVWKPHLLDTAPEARDETKRLEPEAGPLLDAWYMFLSAFGNASCTGLQASHSPSYMVSRHLVKKFRTSSSLLRMRPSAR